MALVLAILAVLIQFVVPVPVADDLLITLPDGQVQGTTYTTPTNGTFYAFQGIPYATPPVGSLRFEAPRPNQPWEGVWDATKDSNACLSSLNFIYKDSESEDCLYLTVYTKSLKPANKLPVLLWIYGGGFVTGSARKTEYGPDFFMDEDIVFVSFNYRLGAFGFLSTGDSAIVGNAGLKDQVLAIKWAHDNVKYFGGDPDKITIFGESAGGASTGLMLVNQKTAGLYRAAIVESGSALTNWSVEANPKAYADLLTTHLGGETYINDTQLMKQFLQSLAPQELLDAANLLSPKRTGEFQTVNFNNYVPNNIPFPVIEVENEDSFLTESPYVLLDSGRFNKVPIIIGICANEALMIFKDLETTQATALMFDNSTEKIIPTDLRQNASDDAIVIETIQNLFLTEGERFYSNLIATTNLYSDLMFTKGVIKHAELASKHVPVYLYQFAYDGRPLTSFVLPGAEKAGHGAELPFLFKMSRSNTTDPVDILTQNRIVKMWVNFATYLNPTPEKNELINVSWPLMETNELQFLNINNTLDVRSPIRGANYQKWNEIYDTYAKKPFTTF